MAILDKLTFNFNDAPNNLVIDMTAPIKKHMDMVTGYMGKQANNTTISANTIDLSDANNFINPVGNSVIRLMNDFYKIANVSNGIANLVSLRANSNTAQTSANLFYAHTNRLSGINPPGTDKLGRPVPYLTTATSVGKLLSYYAYRLDGVANNITTMGNFTSIMINTQLLANSNTINVDAMTVSNSISWNGSAYVSNLSSTVINRITSNIANVTIYIDGRRDHDEKFFQDSINLLKNTKLTSTKPLGQTQQHIIDNFIKKPT